jgi:hypothetical protein
MTKLAANRANAQHSTGPKDTMKTRFNGVRHGLTSKQTVIPGECQQEYDEFQARFLRDLNPQSEIERTMAERTIAAAWRLKRFQRIEAAYFDDRVNAYLEDNPEADPDSALAFLFIDPAEIAKTKLFLRYQTTVQREFDKALSEFRKARAEREKQLLEEAVLQAARERQVPQKTMTAAVSGFASQPAAEPDGYFTTANASAPPAAGEMPRPVATAIAALHATH